MIPRGLLPGAPIDFHDLQPGDVIDTYSPDRQEESRFHRRLGQTVLGSNGFRCDIDTDYDMICVHFGLWIQLRFRPNYHKENTR